MIAQAQKASPGQALAVPPVTEIAANADRLRNGPRLTHVGRYELVECVSEDVNGSLYNGWDPLLARPVSIKTLQFGLKMSSRITVDRQLLRAARASSDLNHRGIASVYDTGLSAHGTYLVMERLEGQDLRSALLDGWRPTLGEAIKTIRRLANALAYAHARRTVHGGLEPGGIFLTRSGRPKLMNFGLVGALHDAEVPELATSQLGTPAYRAPEQLAGGVATVRSDIYALGTLMYELLSGRRAFAEDAPEALLHAMLNGPAVALADLRPDLPQAVLHLVESAMAFEPAARPASAHSMAATLRSMSDLEHLAAPAVRGLLQAPVRAKPHWTARLGFANSVLGFGNFSLFPSWPSKPAPRAVESRFGSTLALPRGDSRLSPRA